MATVDADDGETWRRLEQALAASGLTALGGFCPDADLPVDLPGGGEARTVILVGNVGSQVWEPFTRSPEFGRADDPLDSWTRRVVGAVAAGFGAEPVFPSDGPPYRPFQLWAARTGAAHPSPIGFLIHPAYGLWHAYRAALLFAGAVALPAPPAAASPCLSCADTPCLSTCPVDALSRGGYDIARCAGHLRAADGEDCMALGCRARRACPVAVDHHYDPAHAAFHMTAFRRARG